MNELEQEKRIKEIAAQEIPYESREFWQDELMQVLRALAAELGKEREVDKEKYIQAALARDKQTTEDRDALESIIESLKTQCALRSAGHDDLRTRLNQANQQLSQLKRELSEAREESAYLRKSTEGHEKTIGDCHDELRKLRAQLLALSVSYQRQKEALERLYNYQAQRSSPDTAWDEPMMRNARAALAETPDVSLLELPSEVASEREPEAPVARAFNTSEGLINIKEKLERHFAARFDCKCSPEKHCVCIENFEASLIALAADLGKEREVIAFTPDIDGDPSDKSWREESDEWFKYARKVTEEKEALEAENATLKRRLDEAMKDSDLVEWLCSNPSKVGIKPEYTAHSTAGLVCEYTDVRQLVDNVKTSVES